MRRRKFSGQEQYFEYGQQAFFVLSEVNRDIYKITWEISAYRKISVT